MCGVTRNMDTVYLGTYQLCLDCLEWYGVASVFSGGDNQSVLSATVSTGRPHHRGEEGEEWSVSVVVENALGNIQQ